MIKSKIGRRVAIAGTIGVASLMAAMGAGAGIAGALPSDPATGAPSFNNGVVSQIRGTGSDTTFYMMQAISDLYTSAGLYGCTLNAGTTGEALFNSTFTSASTNQSYYCKANANVTTTDSADNWSRTEVAQGVDNVGSGAGQNQLCGSTVAPSPLPVDFSRSSKPKGSACGDLQQTGYAKDSVPMVEFSINPSALYGSVASGVYSTVNGGSIGNVVAGWLPGDPTAGPNTGTPFTNVANNDNGTTAAAPTSTAYRLWCASTLGNTSANRITDWGQLTNLGPNMQVTNAVLDTTSPNVVSQLPDSAIATKLSAAIVAGDPVTDLTTPGNIPAGTTVVSTSGDTLTLSANPTAAASNDTLQVVTGAQTVGFGNPIGLQVRIMGVNSASGTEATWASYANSGASAGGCASNTNTNAATGPNPATATGDNAGQHISLENNASQVTDFAAADWPGAFVAQAVEAATSLYYMSNGVYTANSFANAGQINGTVLSTTKANVNGLSPTTPRVLGNQYATARTLFNIYRTGTVRASTAGFLNWICDSQTGITKQKDNSTGRNFDAELTTTITSFGFLRLSDTSAVASGGNTPADNVSNGGINTACASGLNGGATAGNGTPAITSVANPNS